jgi:uncharacterized protein (DUF1778 family)
MCSWIVTKPTAITEKETAEFFKETYKFLENRYGRENVISAYVHMDETTPHLHFAFVPITKNTGKKKGAKTAKEYTVSADNVITRKELTIFHTELATHMYNVFNRDVGISSGITEKQGGNKTIQELKATTQAEYNKIINEACEEAHKIYKQSQYDYNSVIEQAKKEAKEIIDNALKTEKKGMKNYDYIIQNAIREAKDITNLAEQQRDLLIEESNLISETKQIERFKEFGKKYKINDKNLTQLFEESEKVYYQHFNEKRFDYIAAKNNIPAHHGMKL